MVDADIDLMKKNPNAWSQVSQSLDNGHVLALLGSSTEEPHLSFLPVWLFQINWLSCCEWIMVAVVSVVCFSYLDWLNVFYISTLIMFYCYFWGVFIVFFFFIVLGLSTLKSFPLKCDVEKVKWMNRNDWIFLYFINMSRGSIWYNKKSLLTSCLFVFSWNTINSIEGLIFFFF